MKELEINIRKNGYDYVQKAKTEHGYIYAQMNEGKVIGYEVFRRKYNKRFDCISFPGDEAFGLWAWNHKILTTALYRLNQLAKTEESESIEEKEEAA